MTNSDFINDLHNHGVDVKNREIFLHSYIANSDEDPGVDYRMVSTFTKNLRMLDVISDSPIIIHMQSIGGNWNDGMAIYDAISLCKSYVQIIAYGQAESMSSIILQAADLRIMMPNAYFMAHYGSFGFDGNYLDGNKYIDFQRRTTEKMLDIYTEAAKNGKFFKEKMGEVSEQKIKNYLKRKLKDGDWYLNANETVYYGFADGVLSTRNYKNIESLKK